MEIIRTASFEVKESGIKFDDLKNLVNDSDIPGHATLSVYTYAGDQRDPGYSTLTFEWTT